MRNTRSRIDESQTNTNRTTVIFSVHTCSLEVKGRGQKGVCLWDVFAFV